LLGVLAILSIISCHTLLKRHGRLQPIAILLCLTIFVLFTSTTIYLVIHIIYYHTQLTTDFFHFSSEIIHCFYKNLDPSLFSISEVDTSLDLLWQQALMQGCIGASTLTVNVILGDVIVCWQACVIWHKNYVVKAACAVILLATLALGVIDSSQSCQPYQVPGPMITIATDDSVPGSLFEGVPIGVATCVLSLSTNMLATLLVAYKSWQSRWRLKGYLFTNIGGSQVEKFLALLTESGAIYCAIWSAVVAFQISLYNPMHSSGGSGDLIFIKYFTIIMDGALVHVIAIYPTIIIVLVALNKSHMERAISQHLESIPTPHLANTADTETTSLDEGPSSRRRSGVLVFDGQEAGLEGGSEDWRNHTSEERKAEGIVHTGSFPLDP
ncbi:hypothetical protein V8D89_011010, partial [Ganoderma adspersum]